MFEIVPLPAFRDNYIWTLRDAHHVAYYGAGSLYCGDTLFGCGCGKVFEGTPAQMYASLQRLAALPEETKVYCGAMNTRSPTSNSRDSANNDLGARISDPVRVFAAIREWKNRG